MQHTSQGGAKGPSRQTKAGAATSRPSRFSQSAQNVNTLNLEQGDPLGRERHSGPPRTLNVWDFASARATEINSLHESLKRFEEAKGLFTLARHLRRRTTSHNRRQFLFRPKKQKVGDEEGELDTDAAESKPLSRKVRRRAMLQAIRRGENNQDSDGVIRLETHIWHAKRFAMETHWGHVLAAGLPGRGRGSRSVLRGAKTAALVHDTSYIQPIQLTGPLSALFAILEAVSTFHKPDLNSVAYGVGSTDGKEVERIKFEDLVEETMIHRKGAFPLGAIAPATLMWRRIGNAPQYAKSDPPPEARLIDAAENEGVIPGDPMDVSTPPEAEFFGLGEYVPLENASMSKQAASDSGHASGQQKDEGLPRGLMGRDAIGGIEDVTAGSERMALERGEGAGAPESAGGSESTAERAQCLLWVHVAAFEEALEVLTGACADQGTGATSAAPQVSCRSREGEFVRLDLTGVEATTVLSKVVRPVRRRNESTASTPESAAASWQVLDSSASWTRVPSRTLLSVAVEDPRLSQSRQQSENIQSEAAQPPALQPGMDYPPGFPPTLPGGTIPTQSTPSPTPRFQFSPTIVVGQLPRSYQGSVSRPDVQNATISGSPTHGGDDSLLWDPPRGTDQKPTWPRPASDGVLSERRRQSRLAEFGLPPDPPSSGRWKAGGGGWRKKEGADNDRESSPVCPALLVKRPGAAAAFAGWTLIVPSGWAMAFWVPLIYAGAHAIGQRERHWIATEAEEPVFPYDYPDCPAYARTMRIANQALLNEYGKKPRSKRPPKPPFLLNWEFVGGFEAAAATQDSLDDPMGEAANDACRYYVARDRTALARATGGVTRTVDASKASGRARGNVTGHGLSRGRLTWKAVEREPGREASSREVGCLVEALLKMPRKGVPEQGAQILAPKDGDFEVWCKSRNWQGVEFSQEHRKNTGGGVKGEARLSEGSESRHVIGHVTSPSPPSGSAQSRAFVICRAAAVQKLRAKQFYDRSGSGAGHVFVLVRNLGSNVGRPGLLKLKVDLT